MVISSNNANALTKEIHETLNAIPGACSEAFDQAGKKAGKEAVKKLKQTAPRRNKNRAGDWKVTKEKNGSYFIHSKNPWLPHLLENGHRVVAHGKIYGSTRARPYIAPVEAETIKAFETYFVEEVGKKMQGVAK